MSGKRIGGTVCLILAACLFLGAVNAIATGDGPALNDASGLGVSRAVGAFAPFMAALILGLWLIQKPRGRESAKPGDPPDRKRL